MLLVPDEPDDEPPPEARPPVFPTGGRRGVMSGSWPPVWALAPGIGTPFSLTREWRYVPSAFTCG